MFQKILFKGIFSTLLLVAFCPTYASMQEDAQEVLERNPAQPCPLFKGRKNRTPTEPSFLRSALIQAHKQRQPDVIRPTPVSDLEKISAQAHTQLLKMRHSLIKQHHQDRIELTDIYDEQKVYDKLHAKLEQGPAETLQPIRPSLSSPRSLSLSGRLTNTSGKDSASEIKSPSPRRGGMLLMIHPYRPKTPALSPVMPSSSSIIPSTHPTPYKDPWAIEDPWDIFLSTPEDEEDN